MPISEATAAQFNSDAALVQRWANGDATTIVQTANGPVRSAAKLIADKEAEIDAAIGQISTTAPLTVLVICIRMASIFMKTQTALL